MRNIHQRGILDLSSNYNILIPLILWISLANLNEVCLLKKEYARSSLSQLAWMVTVSKSMPIFDRYYRGFSLDIKTGLKLLK